MSTDEAVPTEILPARGILLSLKKEGQERPRQGDCEFEPVCAIWQEPVSKYTGRMRQDDHKFEFSLGNLAF